MSARTARRSTGVTAALLAVLGLALASAPAVAAPDRPHLEQQRFTPANAAPVTNDDRVRVLAGGSGEVAVLANDRDADRDELAICRVEERVEGLSVLRTETLESFDPETLEPDLVPVLQVQARANLAPGRYEITYYACDEELLTPGTLTVKVVPGPQVRVRPIEARPGYVRVRHDWPAPLRFVWVESGRETAGRTVLRPGETRRLRVHNTRLLWFSYTRSGSWFGNGQVRGIELPPGERPRPAPEGIFTFITPLGARTVAAPRQG